LHVGDNIRRLRKAKGLSQGAIATLGGFDRPYISRVETGKQTPSLKFLRRLGEILDLPMAEFFIFPAIAVSDDWLDEFARERLYVDLPPMELATLGALRDRRVPERRSSYPGLRARVKIGTSLAEFTAPSPDVFAVRVPNNAAAPQALQGDVVAVDPCGELRPGDMVVIEPRAGAAAELRQFQESGEQRLYATFDGTAQPLTNPEHVWGRVFHKMHVYDDAMRRPHT